MSCRRHGIFWEISKPARGRSRVRGRREQNLQESADNFLSHQWCMMMQEMVEGAHGTWHSTLTFSSTLKITCSIDHILSFDHIHQCFSTWQFFDSKFVTRGEGREVTRVRRSGTVKVSLDVLTRGEAISLAAVCLGHGHGCTRTSGATRSCASIGLDRGRCPQMVKE